MSTSTNLLLCCQSMDCTRPLESVSCIDSNKIHHIKESVITCSFCKIPLFCSQACKDLSSRAHEICCEYETREGISSDIHMKILFNVREVFSKIILARPQDSSLYLHVDLFSEVMPIQSKVEDIEKIAPYTSWNSIQEALEYPSYIQVRRKEQVDFDEITLHARTDSYKVYLSSQFDLKKVLLDSLEDKFDLTEFSESEKESLENVFSKLLAIFNKEKENKKMSKSFRIGVLHEVQKIKGKLEKLVEDVFSGVEKKLKDQISVFEDSPYNLMPSQLLWMKQPKLNEIREIGEEIKRDLIFYIYSVCYSSFLSLSDSAKRSTNYRISSYRFFDDLTFLQEQLNWISVLLETEIEENTKNLLESYLKEKQRQPLLGGSLRDHVVVRCRGDIDDFFYFDDMFKFVRVESAKSAIPPHLFRLDSGLGSSYPSEPQSPVGITGSLTLLDGRNSLQEPQESSSLLFSEHVSEPSTSFQSSARIDVGTQPTATSELDVPSLDFLALNKEDSRTQSDFNLSLYWFYRNNRLREPRGPQYPASSSKLYKMEKPKSFNS